MHELPREDVRGALTGRVFDLDERATRLERDDVQSLGFMLG